MAIRPALSIAATAVGLLAGLSSGGLPAIPAIAQAADPSRALAIIVNRRNSVDELSLGELRSIFLLERQYWPTGRRITLVLREEGQPERTLALQLICRMADADYRRHVMRETFRGNVSSAGPRDIRTAEGMVAFVFNAPGAIGYVRLNEADDRVKVLRIEGRLPSQAGYRLVEAAPRQGPAQPEDGR